MLGPYIKSRGTRSIEMSANADLNTVETYLKLHIKYGSNPIRIS